MTNAPKCGIMYPTRKEELMRIEDTIEELHNKNREIIAKELVQLIKDIEEDPYEDVELDAVSLRYFADFLISNDEFADPVVGPDPSNGIIQAEWRIFGDGLMVMAFKTNKQVHFIAQAEPSETEKMRISEMLTKDEIIEKYRNIIPTR